MAKANSKIEELAKQQLQREQKQQSFADDTLCQSAAERISSALACLIFQGENLIAALFGTLHRVPIEKFPAPMGVAIAGSRFVMYYNPKMIMKYTKKQLMGILCHEAMHILLGHLTNRALLDESFLVDNSGKIVALSNIAFDFAINPLIPYLSDDSKMRDSLLFPKQLDLEEKKCMEWYYHQLKDKFNTKENSITFSIQGFGDSKGQEQENGQEGDEKQVNSHAGWKEVERRKDMAEALKERIRNLVEQHNRKAGKVTGSCLAEILAANKKTVNWKAILRGWKASIIDPKKESTKKRPNRRYGIIHPGKKRIWHSKLIVGIDTSGSVPDEGLAVFYAELQKMFKEGYDITEIQFDYDIQSIKHWGNASKNRQFEICGRGGTNFDPVINYANKHRADGLIVLTDGYAKAPKNCKCRLLWALLPNCKQPKESQGKSINLTWD